MHLTCASSAAPIIVLSGAKRCRSPARRKKTYFNIVRYVDAHCILRRGQLPLTYPNGLALKKKMNIYNSFRCKKIILNLISKLFETTRFNVVKI